MKVLLFIIVSLCCFLAQATEVKTVSPLEALQTLKEMGFEVETYEKRQEHTFPTVRPATCDPDEERCLSTYSTGGIWWVKNCCEYKVAPKFQFGGVSHINVFDDCLEEGMERSIWWMKANKHLTLIPVKPFEECPN